MGVAQQAWYGLKGAAQNHMSLANQGKGYAYQGAKIWIQWRFVV